MKKILFPLPLMFAFLVAACQSGNDQTINSVLSVEAFDQQMQKLSDEQLLDVRTPEEYSSGHIAGSVNLNIYDAGFKDAIGKLDKSRPVMVYCKAGGRSASAASQLAEMGFKEIYDLKGGMLAWSNAGKPSENDGSKEQPVGMTLADYQKKVSEAPLVLVDFKATWCMPCKKLAPILDELVKKEKGRLTLLKVDADEHPGLLKEKNIEGIPYLELYKDGKLVWQHMGMTDEATIAGQLK